MRNECHALRGQSREMRMVRFPCSDGGGPARLLLGELILAVLLDFFSFLADASLRTTSGPRALRGDNTDRLSLTDCR